MNEVHILNYLSALGIDFEQTGRFNVNVLSSDKFPCENFRVDPVKDTWTWSDRSLYGRGAWDFIDKCEQGSAGDPDRIKARLAEVMDGDIFSDEYGITIPQIGKPGAKLSEGSLVSIDDEDFRLPPRSFNAAMMEKYLIDIRGISRAVLNYFVKTKQLYESGEEILNESGALLGYDHRLVFCGRNNLGVVISATKKSMEEKGSYTNVSNSDKENALFTFPENIPDQTDELIIFESEIDLMSYLSLLEATGRDWRLYPCISLGGITANLWVSNGLKKLLQRLAGLKTIRLSFDNDEQGRRGAASLALHLTDYYADNGVKPEDMPVITALHPGVSSLSYHMNADINDWNEALRMYKGVTPDSKNCSKFDLKKTFKGADDQIKEEEASADDDTKETKDE